MIPIGTIVVGISFPTGVGSDERLVGMSSQETIAMGTEALGFLKRVRKAAGLKKGVPSRGQRC